MRAVLPTLSCLLIAAKVSIACSVVQVGETLPSSPNVRLNVLKDGTPLRGATLVVSLLVNARAREFEGRVKDVTGPSIPPAKVVVYVLRSGSEPSRISLEADQEGRFSVPLSPGNYSAAFQSPGFRTRFVGFAIGPGEAQRLTPVVPQVGSCT
jgi:hypothetical protein